MGSPPGLHEELANLLGAVQTPPAALRLPTTISCGAGKIHHQSRIGLEHQENKTAYCFKLKPC